MNTELKLWKYSKDLYYGKIEGLFVSSEKDIDDQLVSTTVYFGEVLGKHSEVSVNFEKSDFEHLDISKKALEELLSAVKGRSISGYYPFQHSNEEVRCLNCGYETNYGNWMLDVSFKSCPRCNYQYCEII